MGSFTSSSSTRSLIGITLLAISLLQPRTSISVTDSDTSNVCDLVNCGNGTCYASNNGPFGYRCECEYGWKRTHLNLDDNVDDGLQFLPCLYPNCTMNYDCLESRPPLPSVAKSPYNPSFSDLCQWIYCGEGTCNHITGYKHVCECKEGYNNLLNASIYPCFSNCMIGSDCASLGILGAETSDTAGTQATLTLPWNFNPLIFLMVISLTMVQWK
ncbi:protein lin-12-like [Macadamia integrifolia]|uniref:protein lin-12-like n=1 Tax=Macadamia integrifolia TaxID=60698 RepID=UPI001C4ECC9E|nr:protein lin-12-like [Macadamia integrifolia]